MMPVLCFVCVSVVPRYLIEWSCHPVLHVSSSWSAQVRRGQPPLCQGQQRGALLALCPSRLGPPTVALVQCCAWQRAKPLSQALQGAGLWESQARAALVRVDR